MSPDFDRALYGFVWYAAFCPEVPIGENVQSTCGGAWSGIRCELTCAPGTVELLAGTDKENVTRPGERSLYCDGSAVWRSGTTPEVVDMDDESAVLLECFAPVCVTTIGYAIEGLSCDYWSEDVTEYVVDIPFEVGRNISVAARDSTDTRIVQLSPGDTAFSVTNDYSFVVRMAGTFGDFFFRNNSRPPGRMILDSLEDKK